MKEKKGEERERKITPLSPPKITRAMPLQQVTNLSYCHSYQSLAERAVPSSWSATPLFGVYMKLPD